MTFSITRRSMVAPHTGLSRSCSNSLPGETNTATILAGSEGRDGDGESDIASSCGVMGGRVRVYRSATL